MQKPRDNKKKDLYNDQTYESIKNIMSNSISLQVTNKNASVFYQKNMTKQFGSLENLAMATSLN